MGGGKGGVGAWDLSKPVSPFAVLLCVLTITLGLVLPHVGVVSRTTGRDVFLPLARSLVLDSLNGNVSSGNQVPAPSGVHWKLVATDNFNANSVNAGSWYEYQGPGNDNIGLRDPSADQVNGGRLTITGTQQASNAVSGGMQLKRSQVYGRWLIRARQDKGSGYGPAILLWPADDNWPDEGELDIVEMPEGDRTKAHQTVHFGSDNQQNDHTVTGDFANWHTYGVDWTPQALTFSIDGKTTFIETNPKAIPTKPMVLALQNDIGAVQGTDGSCSSWIQCRNNTTPTSVALHVDWIKMYARG